MPRTLEIDGRKMSVATEAELLAFANSIREAGGAGVIEALLPSEPENHDRCLIASALNFGCSVNASIIDRFADGSYKWSMELPSNITVEQRKALGKVKGVRLLYEELVREYRLTLPKHIGNAGYAFDLGEAFQSYAVKS